MTVLHKRSPLSTARKAISPSRDRLQSEVVSGFVGALLAGKATAEIVQLPFAGGPPLWFVIACGISLVFAVMVALLRAVTWPAAAMGGLVCLHVLMRQELGDSWQRTAMPSLLALFLLTYAATKFGLSRKEAMGIAEARGGRRASQIIANLGVAGLVAAGGNPGSPVSIAMLAACIAALAEATADTVSSEVGQALSQTRWAGPTVLITSGQQVSPGTDGGVTLAGTGAGAVAAAIVVLLSPFAHSVELASIVFTSACAGLLFDSFLGATAERRGWLGNDLVNLSSTLFAASLALFAALVA